MRIFVYMILALACFTAHAATVDSCAKKSNILWDGLQTYNGPSDKVLRINDVIAKGSVGMDNALTVAVWFGYDDVVKKLINKRGMVEKYGAQSLYLAASMGRLTEMSMLIHAGVSTNAEVKTGLTPIYGATEHGCVQAMQLLVDYGANVNWTANSRWTLLEDAIISRQFDAAKFLLDHGYTANSGEKRRISDILMRIGMSAEYSRIFGGH